jgi:hypothetical protein
MAGLGTKLQIHPTIIITLTFCKVKLSDYEKPDQQHS